jgi:hypothetical protein
VAKMPDTVTGLDPAQDLRDPTGMKHDRICEYTVHLDLLSRQGQR